MTLTDSNFYKHSYTQETRKSSYANELYETAHDRGTGPATHFHQKEIVVPRSIGAILTDRNSGSGLQVKTIKLSYQIWNALGAIQ